MGDLPHATQPAKPNLRTRNLYTQLTEKIQSSLSLKNKKHMVHYQYPLDKQHAYLVEFLVGKSGNPKLARKSLDIDEIEYK